MPVAVKKQIRLIDRFSNGSDFIVKSGKMGYAAGSQDKASAGCPGGLLRPAKPGR
jgi:hypothetical protein